MPMEPVTVKMMRKIPLMKLKREKEIVWIKIYRQMQTYDVIQIM